MERSKILQVCQCQDRDPFQLWILCCHLSRHHPKFWLLFGHYITESLDEDKWTTTVHNNTDESHEYHIEWNKPDPKGIHQSNLLKKDLPLPLFLSYCFYLYGLCGGFLVCSSVTVYLVAMSCCCNYCFSSILLSRRTTPSLFLFFRISLSSFTKKQTCDQTIPVGNLIRNTIICRSVWRTILVLKFQSMDMVKSSFA